jgi:7-carboxy-7-deazaguanine synthase
MFGKNEIQKQDLEAGHLIVQEIFKTIQGEGPMAGRPAIFIRLSGCNLRCSFCDTDFESVRQAMSYEAVMAMVKALCVGNTIKLVVITGGEPLLQPLAPLIWFLFQNGFMVQIETAGTVWDDALTQEFNSDLVLGNLMVVVSPKTNKIHPEVARHAYAYKYIIRESDAYSGADGLPTDSTQKDRTPSYIFRPPINKVNSHIYLQPCDEHDAGKNYLNQMKCVEIAMTYGYTVSLQLHKLLNLP